MTPTARRQPNARYGRGVLAIVAALATVASFVAVAPAATADSAGITPAAVAPQPEGWPQFGYQGVITDKSEMQYNPTNEFIFPSVFHAGEYFENPLGEWYLYLAPHDAPAGIMLMYADSLEGPWVEYEANPIIANEWDPHYDVSHISSPDAIWNDEADELFLYFHGENSTTRYATSDDGIHFEYGDVAVVNAQGGPDVTETSYARVFEHPDADSEYAYGMFYMGNERDNIRRIRLAESVDGKTWTVDPDYVVAPGEEEGQNVSAGNLWEWNGQFYVTYHASSGKSYARTIDETLRDVGDQPILLHQASGIGEDVGRVASPEIITYEDDTYLFYESGDRLGATIAWAKAGEDPVVPPPFGGFPVSPDDPLFAQCAAVGSDEFDGALAPVWDRVIREADARHEVVDGELVIPTYAGGVAAAPLLQQELPAVGPWQVTTQLEIDPTQTFQQAGLLLYASDTRYAKFDLGRATPGRTVELVYHRDGSNRQDSAAPAVEGATQVWLRLTSDGNEIRASVSYDGQDFAPYGRAISVAEAGFTHIGPYAFRGSEATPEIPALFDWVRFSPTAEAYEECLAEPEPLPDDEEAPPAPGVLSSTSGWDGLRDGTFELRWNMWWGPNASKVIFYENGHMIETREREASGPDAQSLIVPIEGRGNGTYEYTAEVINSQGVSHPRPLTVTVTDANPSAPKLSDDNRDGNGSFTLTANMWWGTNATSWRLLENGAEIAAGELEASTPDSQRVSVAIENRDTGSYVYVIEFSNAAGTTASEPHTVAVR